MRKAKLSNSTDAHITSSDNYSDARTNTTGRYIVVFRDNAINEGIERLQSAGLNLAVSPASGEKVLKEEEVGDADVIVYPRLGVAVIAGEPEQLKQLAEAAHDSASPILAVEQEKVRRIIGNIESHPKGRHGLTPHSKLSVDYLRGYRSALIKAMDGFIFSDHLSLIMDEEAFIADFDESQAAWGLQTTNVVNSRFSGRGIRVAVLDTGIDLNVDGDGQIHFHPDFEGRTIVSETFVPGTKIAKDGDGHGTHCLGIACGPLRPLAPSRYGIAYNAEIYVAKVLDDLGNGPDCWIIAGIEWAIRQGCQIISLSLGSATKPGESFSVAYENIARRALKAGLLIIAAAGNDSLRPIRFSPVSEPANCPSIMAVGALDQQLEVAAFSNGGINPNGGEVDIAAPGVSVHSSYLTPTGYTRKDGTSAAAAHVAGIAALYAEASSGAVGKSLWDLIIENARSLPFLPQDVGVGISQSP